MDTRYPAHWPAHYTGEEGGKAHAAAMRVREFVTAALEAFLSEK